jgi:hypothetical protein
LTRKATNPLRQSRLVLDDNVTEPTLLGLAVAAAQVGALLSVCVVGMAFVPAFGYIGFTFARIPAILTALVLGKFVKGDGWPLFCPLAADPGGYNANARVSHRTGKSARPRRRMPWDS